MKMAATISTLKRYSRAFILPCQSRSMLFGARFYTSSQSPDESSGETSKCSKDDTQWMTLKEGDKGSTMDDGTQDPTSTMGHVARRGMEKVKETVANIEETAEMVVPGAWGTAKETAERLKDAVVGDDEDKNSISEKIDDNSIQDLRRRANGYDLNDHD